jgi:hypothetical protein
MGGDEFVVVFRNVKSYDEVTLGAKRINDCLNKSIIIDQHRCRPRAAWESACFRATARHGRAAQAFRHRDVPGEGSRPQQRADVQPDHEPQAEASASPWKHRCATRCG